METLDPVSQTSARADALRQQAHLSIFENSPDCVKILAIDGSLMAMNVNGQCVMEIDDFGAVCGAMWPSLWPEPIRAHVEQAMATARAGSIGQFQAQCPTAKGTLKWWDVVVSPLLGTDGSLQGLLSISRDITGQRDADERERKLATKLRFALEVARYGEWDLDVLSGSVSFNAHFEQCFGLAEGATGWRLEHLFARVHAADRAAVAAALQSAQTGQAGLNVEFRVVWPDTTIHWVHMRGSRYLEAGYDNHLTGLISDVTGRARDAEALKSAYLKEHASVSELERQLNQQAADRDRMWRLSTDLMLVADFNSRIVSINPAWTSILGHQPPDVIGNDFLGYVHADDHAATIAEVGRLASGLTTLRFENRYRHADGSWRDISWTAVPDIDLIHAVGRDITDEKRAAEALRQTESALLQSQKLESIGKLTGGVAHDFNNVLQIISGNLQLLQMAAGADAATLKRLATATVAVERGARLASQLLSFARRHPLKPVVADLRELLQSMDDLLQRAIGESVAVELAVDHQLWRTLIDPNQLENVLLNLAINARDAMDGEGRLTIELRNAELDAAYCAGHPELCPGQYVMLAVSDTGCGIAPELADKVFEPFFTTKREGEGTGLGLSMAYGFIKQSGGHIKVYSEVGHGTTFKLYLPRSMAELESLPAALNGPVVGGSETVLVVEDDAQVRETVVEILKGLGYAVLKAADGQSALSIIESGLPIDLLFTDVVMPGSLRSPELARRAKAVLPGLEVLFTSGYTQNAIVHGGRLDAGVELLSKPYRREDLARKIRFMFANKQHVEALHRERSSLKAAPPQAGCETRRRSILLVEDNEDARMLTAELLESLGHGVDAVGTAEEALLRLARGDIEVLLTDISLPRMSGIDLAAQARAERPALDIVFVSGHDKDNAGLSDPAAKFLLKPFNLAQLDSALGC
nr:response regulator [uncultured Duganella sp.]